MYLDIFSCAWRSQILGNVSERQYFRFCGFLDTVRKRFSFSVVYPVLGFCGQQSALLYPMDSVTAPFSVYWLKSRKSELEESIHCFMHSVVPNKHLLKDFQIFWYKAPLHRTDSLCSSNLGK